MIDLHCGHEAVLVEPKQWLLDLETGAYFLCVSLVLWERIPLVERSEKSTYALVGLKP